ncbi:hypothetical protein [Algibacillus agarilyticus]|uniref:hypothetical protein n=1 Tax=Algibacillus agarilyticus TaxID=2234133 RepID=UPI000DCFE18F|nr:hypothetical protein [Algibacillus agarilyticus]
MRIIQFLLLVLCCISASATVAKQIINLPGKDGDALANTMLKEAFKRGGRYEINYPSGDKFINMSRQIELVKSGEYHLNWTLTSAEYEEMFIPIRIPLYRGMLGMRVGIVKKDRVNLFRNVRTLDDLQAFTAGQGRYWGDTAILEANGVTVVKEEKYPNLFPMLEGERYDYFPRGVHEPWAEVANNADLDLTVEPYVLIRYTAPFYFFVSREYPEIARHLTEELEKMVADGTFNKIFFADSQVRSALEQANVQDRIVFDFHNPSLTKQTPLDRKELWFDPLTYKPES